MTATNTGGPLAKVLACVEAKGLGLKRGFGQEWSSRCPGHDDKEPSLSIGVGENGTVLIHCHAGCETEYVVEALGLKMRDLFPHTRSSSIAPTRPAASRRKPRRLTTINEAIYAIVPGMISEQACPTCVALYTALDLRCGQDNRPQRGVRSLETAMHIDRRTIMTHARHLASVGWIDLDAGATETGGHPPRPCRSNTIQLANVSHPMRDHQIHGT